MNHTPFSISSLKRGRDHHSTVVSCSSEPAGGPSTKPPPYGRSVVPKSSDKPCEDHWVASHFSASTGKECTVYAVFDGHGGSDAASRFACSRLVPLLQEQLSSSTHAESLSNQSVEEALHAAFQQTDAELATVLAEQPLGQSCPGTTATVALVTTSHIHLAWAGDSRAVVLAGSQVLAYTQEHTAARDDEQVRLKAAGCHLFSRHGPPRVMGVLATTRAIGDHDLRTYGVVPTPDVLTLQRDQLQEFLVLASDGLWDVIENQEVYRIASETLRRVCEKHAAGEGHKRVCCPCHAAGVAARALAQQARKKGSADDITVLVVNLKTACSCPQPLGAHYTHNSSLMGKKVPERLQRAGGLFGSSSAHQGEPASPAARHSKEAKLQGTNLQLLPIGVFGSELQLDACQQLELSPACGPPAMQSPPRQLQQQPQQQQSRVGMRSPFSGMQSAFNAGCLNLQPSVCQAAAGTSAARRQQIAAASHAAGLHAAAARPSATDLVMASPFAGMLARAAAAATEVPAAATEPELEAVDTSNRSSSSGTCGATRLVGSAPAELDVPAGKDQVAISEPVSLGLAYASNRRTCGVLGSAPVNSLGSTELPVIVTT